MTNKYTQAKFIIKQGDCKSPDYYTATRQQHHYNPTGIYCNECHFVEFCAGIEERLPVIQDLRRKSIYNAALKYIQSLRNKKLERISK
jgi:hypothetical protein